MRPLDNREKSCTGMRIFPKQETTLPLNNILMCCTDASLSLATGSVDNLISNYDALYEMEITIRKSKDIQLYNNLLFYNVSRNAPKSVDTN